MLETLTKEQEKLMVSTRDEWINLAFNKNKEGINKPLFEDGVRWLYTDLLKKPIPKIIYCDSWLSCLLTINILNKQASVGGSVGDSVWASVWASVRDSVWDSVWDSELRNIFPKYSSYNGWNNFGWVSFYDFLRK